MIELSNVTKRYGPVTVVDRVSLSIPKTGVTALIGPNDAGKSTLLSITVRLLPADGGRVIVDGLDVSRTPGKLLAIKLSILRQENQVTVWLTVREPVEFGRFPQSQDRLTTEDRKFVDQVIEFLELGEFSARPISRLLGGRRQRAFIAMVLCQDTDYVLLDEPLNNLDMRHASQTMSLIRRLSTELNQTIVIVLYDVNFASYHADRGVAMKDGAIVADGAPGAVITAAAMERIFDLAVPVHSFADMPVVAYFATGSHPTSRPRKPSPHTLLPTAYATRSPPCRRWTTPASGRCRRRLFAT